MLKRCSMFLLLAMLLSSAARGDYECKDVVEKPIRERVVLFKSVMDTLISRVKPGVNGKRVAKALRNNMADGVPKSLSILNIPDVIEQFKDELEEPPEGWEKRIESWKESTMMLEVIAQCHHYGEVDLERPLVFLKLYEASEVEDPDVAFGYIVRSGKGEDTRRSIRYTLASECEGIECNFRDQVLKDADLEKLEKNHSFIRIVHNPKAKSKITEELSDTVNGLPVVSYLSDMKLSKTGEMFTDPEIMVAVSYTDENDQILHKFQTSIPWAMEKGDNKGSTRLLEWQPEYKKAHIVVYEYDITFPLGRILDAIAEGMKYALSFSKEGSALASMLDKTKEALDSRYNSSDFNLTDYFDDMTSNDLIGAVTVTRDQMEKQSKVEDKEGNVILYFDNLYKPKEDL